MSIEKHNFIVDDRGNRTAIILAIAEYEKLMEEIEELEAKGYLLDWTDHKV